MLRGPPVYLLRFDPYRSQIVAVLPYRYKPNMSQPPVQVSDFLLDLLPQPREVYPHLALVSGNRFQLLLEKLTDAYIHTSKQAKQIG